jgi:hypothetical protein
MLLKILTAIVLFALTGNVFAQSPTVSCNIPALPTILFKNTVFLSKKAKLQLDSVVKIAEQYPDCNLRVRGYGLENREGQLRSWDEVNSVFEYLEKKGIPKSKLIFEYSEPGVSNTVKIFGTMDKPPFSIIGCQRSHYQIKSNHP